MKNGYEIRGDVTAIFISSPKFGDHETLISTDKLDLVKSISGYWRVMWEKKTKSFYVAGTIYKVDGKEKTSSLHRFITGAPKGMIVDHINHDTLDNTDSNLRIVTNAENMQNRKGAEVGSKSGIRNVAWDKTRNRWKVKITVNGVHKSVGYFENIYDAENAAIEARMKYMPFSNELL